MVAINIYYLFLLSKLLNFGIIIFDLIVDGLLVLYQPLFILHNLKKRAFKINVSLSLKFEIHIFVKKIVTCGGTFRPHDKKARVSMDAFLEWGK